MRSRWIGVAGRCFGWIAARLPDRDRAFIADDAVATMQTVCEEAYARGAWTFARVATRECANAVAIVVRARWPRRPVAQSRRLTMVDELRMATRRLRARPGTPLLAAAMLALGIGLTAAMFTIADALVLRPVPFRAPDQLGRIAVQGPHGGRTTVSREVLRSWRDAGMFAAIAGASSGISLVSTGNDVVSRGAAAVTPGAFEMLGVSPIRGRTFTPEEGREGTTDRVVLSHEVWTTVFGADPAIVGRRIVVDAQPVTVVGVMPATFRFPRADTALWRPTDFFTSAPTAVDRPEVYVRFGAVPEADALRLATTTSQALDPTTQQESAVRWPLTGFGTDVYLTRAIPALAGGVALVFVVLCANVMSLLLANVTARRRELGLCAALGASRGRLLRQAIAEHAAIGAIASLGGLAMGWLLVVIARAFLPEAMLARSLHPLALDVRALIVTSIAGVGATLVAGLAPSWTATFGESLDPVRTSDRGASESRGARRLARSLLVVESALAVTLLVGAALLIGSFVRLLAVDRGVDPRGVVTAWIVLPRVSFAAAPSRAAAVDRLTSAIVALPGVEASALSFGIPPGFGEFRSGTWTVDGPGGATRRATIGATQVGPGFFDLYRLRLLRGRAFTAADDATAVVLGQRLADLFWPGADPVGRTFRSDDGGGPMHVIGVVQEVNRPSIDGQLDLPEFYRPLLATPAGQPAGFAPSQFMVGLRCETGCPSISRIRQALLAAAPGIRVASLESLEQTFRDDLARPRAAAAMASVFAIVALLAAAGGLFSVLTYAVARRRREFGVRAALGAEPRTLRRLVVRDGLRVGLEGLAIGALAAWVLQRWLASLEYGITAANPLVWGIVLLLIGATTIAATWRPARQAASADPLELLRQE